MCSEHRMDLWRMVAQNSLAQGESSETSVDSMFTGPAPPSHPLDVNSAFFEPCPQGAKVELEATVLGETEGGVLMVEVKWRNRTYIGTLADSSNPDWGLPWISETPTTVHELRGDGESRKRKRTTDGDHSYEKCSPPRKAKRVPAESSARPKRKRNSAKAEVRQNSHKRSRRPPSRLTM